MIKGWDVEMGKNVFVIQNRQQEAFLNTINSLKFSNGNENIFVSGFKGNINFVLGTRDGLIKIFDFRNTQKPAIEFFGHVTKLNSAMFNSSNQFLLSSGRDSVARLWDIRKLKVKQSNSLTKHSFSNAHFLIIKLKELIKNTKGFNVMDTIFHAVLFSMKNTS